MAIQDGVYVASLSVLNKNLSVNSEQTLLHAEKIISLGATGVVLSGSTGQSQNLSFQCKMNLIDQASKSSQNQKIIIGPGTNSLLDTAKLINYAKSKNLKKFRNNLINFLNRKNNTFESDFFIEGNAIQKKVWKELIRIKLGKTKSYGEIAKKFKLSPRHVGKICAQNKIAIAIPCHRVVRSDGSMGGFSARGGIVLKKKILDFEKSWK